MAATRFAKIRLQPSDDAKKTASALSRVQDALAARLDAVFGWVSSNPMGGGPRPAWVDFELLNGFSNNAATNEANASWHINALGYTYLRGTIATSGGAGANTAICVLPPIARPDYIHRMAAVASGGSIDEIQIDVDGTISILAALPAAATLDLCGSFLSKAG